MPQKNWAYLLNEISSPVLSANQKPQEVLPENHSAADIEPRGGHLRRCYGHIKIAGLVKFGHVSPAGAGIYASPSPQGGALLGKKCNSFTKRIQLKPPENHLPS